MAGDNLLPLLQDTDEQAAWTKWRASTDDLVLVDENGIRVELLGLQSPNGLGDPANYAALKARLKELAGEPSPVPDFELLDVNPTSTETYDTLVSPRDKLGLVTAWYFGGAT